MQVLQRIRRTQQWIATGCIISTATASLIAETKIQPLKDYLDLKETQIISAVAVFEYSVHKKLHNPLATHRLIHTTRSSHNAVLRV